MTTETVAGETLGSRQSCVLTIYIHTSIYRLHTLEVSLDSAPADDDGRQSPESSVPLRMAAECINRSHLVNDALCTADCAARALCTGTVHCAVVHEDTRHQCTGNTEVIRSVTWRGMLLPSYLHSLAHSRPPWSVIYALSGCQCRSVSMVFDFVPGRGRLFPSYL